MISLYTYRLPFTSPFKTGTKTWMNREGILIHYRDNRSDIVGEAAPLPGLSTETLADTTQSLRSTLEPIHTLLSDSRDIANLSLRLDALNLPASAAFAVSAIGIQLISDRSGRTLRELLASETMQHLSGKDSVERLPGSDSVRHLPDDNSIRHVRVNSVVGLLDPESVISEVTDRYNAGFKTIKLKCGRSPGDLPAVMRQIAGRYPDIRFRIDPNRSWPLSKAGSYLNRFADLPVEYCEEPSLMNDLTDLDRLSAESDVPIALDESIGSLDKLGKLLSGNRPEILIIKVPLFGNILRLAGTILKNNTPSSDIVFTSMIDSGIGRTVAGFLAALAGSEQRAHGLDTGRYFKRDILPMAFDNGTFHADTARGWGIEFEHCNKDSLTLLTSYGS